MFGPWTKTYVIILAVMSIGCILFVGCPDVGAVSSTGNYVDHLITIDAVDDKMITLIDFNPKGGTFAVAQENGAVTIYNTTTWEVEGSASTMSPPGDMEFSPDGTRLAFISERIVDDEWVGTLHVLTTADWTDIAKKEMVGYSQLFDMEWSPDGRYLATTDSGEMMIWNTTAWTIERSFETGESFAVGWSPNGKMLAYGNYTWGTENNTVDILNTTTWSLIQSLDIHVSEKPSVGAVFAPAYIGWSADSNILAFTNFTVIFNSKGSEYELEKDAVFLADYYRDTEWRPFGTSLAIINNIQNDTERYPVLMIVNGTNGKVVINETMGDLHGFKDLSWSPNGSRIALSNNQKIVVYNVHLTEQTSGGDNPIPEEEDSDGDGVDDDEDDFPDDLAASVDTDSDGYPDSWNPGKGESDSTTGLTIDIFPEDPTEWVDKDNDGHGDNGDAFPDDPEEWSDKDNDGFGDNEDSFPDDPQEWSDRDNDSHGDNGDAFPDDHNEWADTDDDGYGDNVDAFPTDPAASVDADKDGRPEAWNPGKSEKDSTTGLVLDLAADKNTPLIKQGWFPVMMIGLTILIVISITVVLVLALGWRKNDSSSEEDGLIDSYRNEITSGKVRIPSRKEVDEIVTEKVENGDISLETGSYINGLFSEE